MSEATKKTWPGMDGHTEEAHESYGLAGFSRVSGNSGPLFGSSIKHGHFIRLRIKRAKKVRGLHHNWYHGVGVDIVELDLSYTQFAELLTNMNVGDGVPCTLRYVDGHEMEEPPVVDERTTFNDEFKEDIARVMDNANKLVEDARAMLKAKSVTKADLGKLSAVLEKLAQDVNCNLPFVQKSFNEANEKTVTEAKGEVEAFIGQKIHGLGIKALSDQIEAGGVVQLTDGPTTRKMLPEAAAAGGAGAKANG